MLHYQSLDIWVFNDFTLCWLIWIRWHVLRCCVSKPMNCMVWWGFTALFIKYTYGFDKLCFGVGYINHFVCSRHEFTDIVRGYSIGTCSVIWLSGARVTTMNDMETITIKAHHNKVHIVCIILSIWSIPVVHRCKHRSHLRLKIRWSDLLQQ